MQKNIDQEAPIKFIERFGKFILQLSILFSESKKYYYQTVFRSSLIAQICLIVMIVIRS